MALDFEYSESNYINGVPTGITSDANGSIALWCRPESLVNGTLFGVSDASDSNGIWLQLEIRSDGRLYFQARTGGSYRFIKKTDDVVFAANDLLHIVGTQNGTAPVIYVNGVAVNISAVTTEYNVAAWLSALSGLDTLEVGATLRNNTQQIDIYDGIIYDVAYWNTALTAPQVLQLYAGGRPVMRLPMMVAPTNLMRYWCFDEMTGAVANDMASGYGLALTDAPAWIDAPVQYPSGAIFPTWDAGAGPEPPTGKPWLFQRRMQTIGAGQT